MKIPPSIAAALEDIDLPYEIARGTRHNKIKIAGVLVGTFSRDGRDKNVGRGDANVVAQIRRFVARRKEAVS